MLASDIQKQVGWNCANLRTIYGGNILRLGSATSTVMGVVECDRCPAGCHAVYLDVAGDVALAYCLPCALTLGLAIDDSKIFGS